MNREPGFYWVRRYDEVVVGEWCIPTYAPEWAGWHFAGEDCREDEGDVEVLSPRLTPPDAR